MQVRKFWIVNSQGHTYELTNDKYKHFLANPSNLGFVKDYSYTRIGDEDIINSEQLQLLTFQGELLFMGDSPSYCYEEYSQFMNFIRFTPLKFFYQPANTFTSYYADCLINQLDKGEVGTDGILRCMIAIKLNSRWKSAEENVVSVSEGTVGDGKSYPLTRPYQYAGSTLSNIIVNNNGSNDVGFMFEVIGDVTNPQFSVYYDDEIEPYGICKIIGTFDYVKVDSTDSDEEIYLELDGSSITNAPSYQDLSVANGYAYVTFVRLRSGRNRIVFNHAGIFNGEVKISWHDSYTSV